jgi:hypothetical protein
MTIQSHARHIRIVKAVPRFLKSRTTAMATQTQTLLTDQHHRRAARRPAGGRWPSMTVMSSTSHSIPTRKPVHASGTHARPLRRAAVRTCCQQGYSRPLANQ